MPQKPKQSKSKGFTLRSVPEETHPQTGESLLPSISFEDLGELPHGYGTDTIFLIAQEPHWLFTYWDIDIARHPGGATFLRYYTGSGDVEGEIEVPFETRNWYIPVEQANGDYYVEIGYHRGEAWNVIARSMTVTTPPDGMAASESFDYATVPFHLSYQRLIDQLETALKSGEDLLTAVSRLQQDGDFSAFGVEDFPNLLSEDQRSLLGALLGPDLLSELASGNLSSSEIEAKIRAHLEERISSGGGASEFLSSFRETAGASLFSAGAFSSEIAAGSWSIAALSSWAAGAVSSWLAAGGEVSSWSIGVAGTTSWSSWSTGETSMETTGASGGMSWAAALGASWAQAAFGSWTQSSLGSWEQAALASWSQAAASWGQASSSWAAGSESSSAMLSMSSWLQAVQSSWAQAALSSWSSSEVSSWFSASAVTSWSGSSETLSSFGQERGFFMHVNAEVIFYGGTDPRAKVTIDGQPVALNADGTFRYHFIFPNADYEIPIIAESPDGMETRSAKLRFHRDTGKVGIVTDTPQPPLGAPMGGK